MKTKKRAVASVVYLVMLQKLGKLLPTRRDLICKPYMREVFQAMSSLAFARDLANLITEILVLPGMYEAHREVIKRLVLLADKAKEMQERLRE